MRSSIKKIFTALAAALPLVMGAPRLAEAQKLVAQVNGVPVTSLDIAQRQRFLRVIHRPASANDAFESLVADALKRQDMKIYGEVPKAGDIQLAIQQAADEAHMSPQALAAALLHAGLNPLSLKDHWEAEAGFYVIVGSQNRMVEPTDAAINAELAREGNKNVPIIYTLQAISFILPTPLTVAGLNATARRATAFRASFTSCDTGIARAKAMKGVIVKAPIQRNSAELSANGAALLQKVPLGHLTPLSRDPTGITMFAVCGRAASTDKDAARNAAIAKLQAQDLKPMIAAAYARLRARAVIQRR